jgi:hypothetical protein
LGGKNIKYGQEILELLHTMCASKWLVVIHCQGHKKGDATNARGNQKADKEAKQVALTRGPAPTVLRAAMFPCPLAEWDPQYTPQEKAWFKTEEGNFLPNGWWKFADGHITIPESLHLSSSPMRELIQGKQLLRLPWPSIFMSQSSPTQVRQYVRDVSYVPKTIPEKGQGRPLVPRVLVELLLKT